MRQRRAYRWAFFFLAAACFLYFVAVDNSVWAFVLFLLSGGLWYWLEMRKMRELDAPRPK